MNKSNKDDFAAKAYTRLIFKATAAVKKRLTRETLMYLIFGILTSVLSIVSFNAASKLGFHVTASNTISTVFAVIFAYITNKLFVFKSNSISLPVIIPEIVKFVAGRAFMFLIETVLLIALVSYLGCNKLLAKILTTGIVIVGNYFISKKAVFKKGNTDANGFIS